MNDIYMGDLTGIIKREFLLGLCPCGSHTQAVGAPVPVPADIDRRGLPRDQRRRLRHQPPVLIPGIRNGSIIIGDLV